MCCQSRRRFEESTFDARVPWRRCRYTRSGASGAREFPFRKRQSLAEKVKGGFLSRRGAIASSPLTGTKNACRWRQTTGPERHGAAMEKRDRYFSGTCRFEQNNIQI